MPVMDGHGQEVEVMASGFVTDMDADIALQGHHVLHNVERKRERTALPQKFHDAL